MASFSICQICLVEPQKYCCPRCNILYCSVKCYQNIKHTSCSESFYQECIIKELYNQSKDGTTKYSKENVNKLYEMLQREQSKIDENEADDDSDGEELDSDDDRDEEETDLADRLRDINLDDADAVWNILTKSERKEFEKLILNQDITALLPKFIPWWQQKLTTNLIEDISERQTTAKFPNEMPAILNKIPDFAKLSSKSPAACVPVNIINILGAYCLMVRYFQGEQVNNSEAAIHHLLIMSSNFRENGNFDTQSLAIKSIVHDCQTAGIPIGDEETHQINDDVIDILQGPWTNKKSNFYTLAALSEIHRILNAAKNQDKSQSMNENREKGEFSKRFQYPTENVDRGQLKLLIRKIEYFLAFIKQFQ